MRLPTPITIFDARDEGWTKVILHPAGGPTHFKRETKKKRKVEPRKQPAFVQ